jgi:S1-C subfamily serine protease
LAVSTSAALQSFSDEIEKVAEGAGPSAVSVSSYCGSGTGIVWDDKHIVTAYHVAGDDESADICSDGREITGKVMGHDAVSDIAVIEVEGNLVPMQRGNSDMLKVGQFVLALANPYGGGIGATSGIITGIRKRVGGWWNFSLDEAIVTDARVNPGYSGGPLVNASGKLIGMNVALVSSRGIAVPVNRIGRKVERILSGKTEARPYLGIGISYVRLPAGNGQAMHGLIVMSVEKGSPAENAGLIVGDILLSADGREVAREFAYSGLLGDDTVGREVVLGILRGGKHMDIRAIPQQAQDGE